MIDYETRKHNEEIEQLKKKELVLKKSEQQLAIMKELVAHKAMTEEEYIKNLRVYYDALAKFEI